MLLKYHHFIYEHKKFIKECQVCNYERNKNEYAGKREDIFNEIFAKELGFREFQEVNDNFEYHIIFDAGLQHQQKELYEKISKLN